MESKILNNAAELYAEMVTRGLEIRKSEARDNGLFAELLKNLKCPNDKLVNFLREKNISAEEFLIAFLNVAKPFSKMFDEIWTYLSKHYAPKASEVISLRFGLPDSGNSETINLEQFRRYADDTKLIQAIVQYAIWPADALGRLFQLASKLGGDLMRHNDDIVGYRLGEDLQLPFIQVSSNEMDGVVNDIRNLFQEIIDNYHAEVVENGNRRTNSQLDNVAVRLTNLVPGWYFIFSKLATIPNSNKSDAYVYYNEEIKPLIKIKNEITQTEIKQALDILDLPFWKHRWHTYEIWCTVTALDALNDFKPQPRITDGKIPLDGYSREVIADLKESSYTNPCVAIQEQTDIVIIDKRAMKPDLRVCFSEAINEINNTAAVIEFKQRQAITKNHIEEVAKRYTVGAPKSGGAIIINYDKTGVAPELPPKSYYIEGVRPGNATEVNLFKSTLIKVLEAVNFKKIPNNIVMIDISSSMDGLYDSTVVRNALSLCCRSERVLVFFFNNELVEVNLPSDYECLTTYGSTNLEGSLLQLIDKVGNIGHLLIVSDMDYFRPDNLLSQISFKECTPNQLHKNLSWILS